jgi:hypothetical protein
MRLFCCFPTAVKLRLVRRVLVDETCAELEKWAKTVPSITAVFSRKYVCSSQSTHFVLISVMSLKGFISLALVGNA